MTTDLVPKEAFAEVPLKGGEVQIAGMTKGSGMIHPNMATMLSFITTDVAISPALLQKALKLSVNGTYNMISVDGDTSTNDMVAMLANGAAGNALIDEENDDFKTFCAALNELNYNLARKIAADADGATKRLSVNLYGAESEETGRTLARTVVSSNLVKASLFAEEPNWGRIVVALGYAGVVFNMEHLSIEFKSGYGSIVAVEGGQQHSDYSAATAKQVLQATDVEINIRLKEGDATATAWGCDLRHDYIRNHNHVNNSADQEGQPSGQVIDSPVLVLKYADAV
jgi:glutamate N-acetyltransferase/amino-acid N-acetyltransferase